MPELDEHRVGPLYAAYATPLLYDAHALAAAYPARALTFVVAVVGEVIAVQFLKRRLVRAEAHQRAMAERDPLTGLSNRRTFDRELARAGDCLARIGGDEVALVAPGAGSAGVERIVAALVDAVDHAPMPEDVDRVHATFAWAVAPVDGSGAADLIGCADERLLAGKREPAGAMLTA
jgi:GGDEF domain-containing protein